MSINVSVGQELKFYTDELFEYHTHQKGMINLITLYPIDEFKRGFVVEGHANYDVHGKDIVCSAVSSLAQSVLATIQSKYTTSYIQKSGFIAVNYELNESISHYVEVLLLGMTLLRKQYPEYITISEKEYEIDEIWE